MAAMLNVVLDSCADDLVLLQHDGFTARRQLDKAALESAIEERTGYVMTISEEQIPDIKPKR